MAENDGCRRDTKSLHLLCYQKGEDSCQIPKLASRLHSSHQGQMYSHSLRSLVLRQWRKLQQQHVVARAILDMRMLTIATPRMISTCAKAGRVGEARRWLEPYRLRASLSSFLTKWSDFVNFHQWWILANNPADNFWFYTARFYTVLVMLDGILLYIHKAATKARETGVVLSDYWRDEAVERPLPTTAYHCLPLPTTAYHCLPLPTTAYHCLPLPTTAYHCLPLPTTAYHCLPLPTTAYHCLPLQSRDISTVILTFWAERSRHRETCNFTKENAGVQPSVVSYTVAISAGEVGCHYRDLCQQCMVCIVQCWIWATDCSSTGRCSEQDQQVSWSSWISNFSEEQHPNLSLWNAGVSVAPRSVKFAMCRNTMFANPVAPVSCRMMERGIWPTVASFSASQPIAVTVPQPWIHLNGPQISNHPLEPLCVVLWNDAMSESYPQPPDSILLAHIIFQVFRFWDV